jgi:hypothetical protein
MEFLIWLEHTPLATFIRESPSMFAYPTFLFLHTVGLCMVVGLSSALAVRVLGLAPSIPLAPLRRFFLWMWIGFVMNTVSGLGLMIAEASSIMVNPVFLIKLTFIGFAVVTMWLLQEKMFGDPNVSKQTDSRGGKVLSAILLALWLGSIITGRLIAYII